MPADHAVASPATAPRPRCRAPWMAVGAAILAAGLTVAPVRANPPLLLMDTGGRGPSLHVTGFRVNPVVRQTVLAGQDSDFAQAMLAATTPEPDELQAWLNENGLGVITEQLEIALIVIDGTFLGVSTMTELVFVETSLMALGAAVSVAKTAYHLARGEEVEAASTAMLGTFMLLAQRYGTRTMQLGGIAVAILDIGLQYTGTWAWQARTEATDRAYLRYYRERGRSVNDWKLLLHRLVERRLTPQQFTDAMHAEVARYVARAWDDDYFYELLAGAESRIVGLTRFSELPERVRNELEHNHRLELFAMLQGQVLPELAHRAWLLALDDLAHTANMDLRPQLNAVWEITVEAPDLTEAASYTLHLPTGGSWSGRLQPGAPALARMTTLAFIRAGGPYRVTLDLPEGPQTRDVAWSGRQGRVTFGLPQVVQVISFDLTEGPGQCETTLTHPDGHVERLSGTRPAPVQDRLDIGNAIDGRIVIGRFGPEARWSDESQVFTAQGTSLFAQPARDGAITALSNCDLGLLQGDRLLAGECRVTREYLAHERVGPDADSPGAAARMPQVRTRHTRCLHPAEVSLTGIHILEPEGWAHYPLDGEAGRIIRDSLRQGLEQGFTLQ